MSKTPKIIHYCWFGHGEIPKAAKCTLASWERYAPGFEIRRCDENAFDIHSCEWTDKAYQAKKYAFVSDYVRFRLLYEYGGIYMDLGSELIKDISELVKASSPFSAIEESSKTIAAGLITAAPPHDPAIAAVIARYEALSFCDTSEFLAKHTVNAMFTSELEKLGFVREDREQKVGQWTLLSSSAFNPVYGFGGYHIKKDTYSIHRSTGSWMGKKYQVKKKVVNRLAPIIGRRAAQVLGRIVGEVKENGFSQTCIIFIDLVKTTLAKRKDG